MYINFLTPEVRNVWIADKAIEEKNGRTTQFHLTFPLSNITVKCMYVCLFSVLSLVNYMWHIEVVRQTNKDISDELICL